MLKNFIDKAKQRAQTVIQNKSQSVKLPTFEKLAVKDFNGPTNDLWQYSMDQLCDLLNKYDQFLQQLKKAYENVCDEVQPILNRYEKEKKLLEEASMRDEYMSELEAQIAELQEHLNNSERENEQLRQELENCNENESPDLKENGSLEEDISNLKQQLYYLDADNKQLIQQLVEVQKRHRMEMDDKNKIEKSLNQAINQLKDQVTSLDQRQQGRVQFESQEISELRKIVETKDRQILEVQDELKEQSKQFEKQVNDIQKKRELGIQEIKQLSEQLYGKLELQQRQGWSQAKTKQLRVSVMSQLIGMRKDFEGTYKQYMQLVAGMEEGSEMMVKLMKLEGQMNLMILRLQDLLDQVDDLLS